MIVKQDWKWSTFHFPPSHVSVEPSKYNVTFIPKFSQKKNKIQQKQASSHNKIATNQTKHLTITINHTQKKKSWIEANRTKGLVIINMFIMIMNK